MSWFDLRFNDEAATQVFEGHFPHGASIRQLSHFGQHLKRSAFVEYDYQDPDINFETYGQYIPPLVDLSKI
jgi:lysosomal acid lipase/cholesteryl ester hydrolase